MKILFVVADLFISEPIGIMQLSAICKKNKHSTKLIALRRHSLLKSLQEFEPDIIAYSAMTPDWKLFKEADSLVKKFIKQNKRDIFRVMGGPHPTYFPEVIEAIDLNAICIGEGDNALINIIDRLKDGRGIDNITNVLTRENFTSLNYKKELITNLDDLPYPDREIIYDAVPHYRYIRMKSFMTSRGCPYSCSYCHNHVFNEMFGNCGQILRRRSVASVIGEIKNVILNYQPIKFIHFSDDTFAHTVDDWLIEFLGRYSKEIGIPFYCLMRSNTLNEEMAKILAQAGCFSIGMSVETGDEGVRNNILKRKLADEVVKESFNNARKYKINTFGNTMFGLPSTTLKDDFNSFIFTKRLKLTVPTFGIFCPYPKTELTDYAVKKGLLDKDYEFDAKYNFESALKCFSKNEKKIQLRMTYLASIFCSLPDSFIPLFKILAKLNLKYIYSFFGSLYLIYRTGTKIFPRIYPSNPWLFLKILIESFTFSNPVRMKRIACENEL